MKAPTKEYLEKAKALSRREAELLFSRMGQKLTRKLQNDKFSALEVIAIQLEREDEQLKAWRKQFAEIRAKFKE